MNSTLSRRAMLRQSASCVACALAGDGGFAPAQAMTAGDVDVTSDLQPHDAFQGVLDAMVRFPLVAIGENHQLQEWHDFITALLFHPELGDKVNDIVVEFGNALYQEVADRFVLENEPIANAELQRIWRYTIGGGVLWDAPVYAQFFRNVRALNWMRPRARGCACSWAIRRLITRRSRAPRTGNMCFRLRASATGIWRVSWRRRSWARGGADCFWREPATC